MHAFVQCKNKMTTFASRIRRREEPTGDVLLRVWSRKWHRVVGVIATCVGLPKRPWDHFPIRDTCACHFMRGSIRSSQTKGSSRKWHRVVGVVHCRSSEEALKSHPIKDTCACHSMWDHFGIHSFFSSENCQTSSTVAIYTRKLLYLYLHIFTSVLRL